MKTKLRELWQSRSPRDRAVALALALFVGASVYFLLVQAAERSRARLRASVAALRSQAERVEQQASELERLRAAPPATPSQSDLRTVIQAQANAAGVSRDSLRIEAIGDNQAKVSLGSVAFADWLTWVGMLQSQQVRLDACRIEALALPGLVSATATFTRTLPQ